MDKKAYKNQAEKLVRLFAENVKRFAGEMPEEILNAGPRLEDWDEFGFCRKIINMILKFLGNK